VPLCGYISFLLHVNVHKNDVPHLSLSERIMTVKRVFVCVCEVLAHDDTSLSTMVMIGISV